MSESDGSERREFPRIPLLTEAWLIDEETGDRTHVRTRDLSTGGLCVDAGDHAWPPGRVLRLSLKLPGQTEEVELTAKVAWVAGTTLGVSWHNVAKIEKELIDLTVEQILRDLESMESEKTPT
jgi:hypothetical protein